MRLNATQCELPRVAIRPLIDLQVVQVLAREGRDHQPRHVAWARRQAARDGLACGAGITMLSARDKVRRHKPMTR